jgi:predicted dinucleotide-utilizing enzyme
MVPPENLGFGRMTKATWDRVMQGASVIMTVAILPAAGWAWRIQESQGAQAAQLRELAVELANVRQQLEQDRRGAVGVLDELRALRGSVDTLRVDVLQRITRLETQMESKR